MYQTNPPWQFSGGFTRPNWRGYIVTLVLEQLVNAEPSQRDNYVRYLFDHVEGEKVVKPVRNVDYTRVDHGFTILRHTRHATQRWAVFCEVLFEGDREDLYIKLHEVANSTSSTTLRLRDVSIAALE